MDQPTPQGHPVTSPTTTPTALKPLDISFGVEFEFILIVPGFEERKTKKLGVKVFDSLSQVGKVLRDTEFRCKSCKKPFRMPIGVQPPPPSDLTWKSDHRQWNVVPDDSMKLNPHQRFALQNGDFDTVGVEVTSRKLFADRDVPVPADRDTARTDGHQHTIAVDDEIETVLSALHRAFNNNNNPSPPAANNNELTKQQLLLVNNTCGLHVHVGNDEDGFPLQTLKNVLSLHTAFERVIDSIHSLHRIGGTALALAPLDTLDDERSNDKAAVRGLPILHRDQVPNVPLTEHHIARAWCARRNIAHPLPPPPEPAATTTSAAPPTPRAPPYPSSHIASNPPLTAAISGLHTSAFLETIQATPDIETLVASQPLKETTVSLRYLSEALHSHKTIEFRQHAAVSTAAETLPWVAFVTSLVRYAHASSAEQIRKNCARVADDGGISLRHLLALIAMPDETGDYWLDRVSGVEPFFDHVAARAEVEAAFGGGVDSPLRKVALELIDEREAEYIRVAVGKAVRDKFDAGGYGQFSREFIDVYAADLGEEEKVMLTIGWEAPVTSPEEEFPELPLIEGVEDIDEPEETG